MRTTSLSPPKSCFFYKNEMHDITTSIEVHSTAV